MNNYNYILIGKVVGFDEVGELLSQNREVVHLAFDENTWEEIGVRITPKKYDEMANDWKKYHDDTFFADAQIIKNGGTISIPKGKYDFWLIDRVI